MDRYKFCGLVLGIFGLCSIVINIITVSNDCRTFKQVATSPFVVPVLIFTLLVFITLFINNKISRVIQILLLLIVGITSTLDTLESFFGIGFMLLAFVYLWSELSTRRSRIYLCLFFSFLICIVLAISIKLNDSITLATAINIFFYLISMSFLLLKFTGNKIQTELFSQKNNLEFSNLHEKYKITNAEYRVLEQFVENKSTNDEIARSLNISVSTVKVHMMSIFKKLEVKNRNEIFLLFELLSQRN